MRSVLTDSALILIPRIGSLIGTLELGICGNALLQQGGILKDTTRGWNPPSFDRDLNLQKKKKSSVSMFLNT